MPNQPKILLVDDEQSVRHTLSLLLERFGFAVVGAATVTEALALITQQSFDVLIADLNISSRGDGFTVVSAMRHTHPKAVTLILTGYPDFDSAWRAIQQQVDDYFIKPADIDKLVEKINSKLTKRTLSQQVETERLSVVLRRDQDQIISQWLRIAKDDVEISAMRISDSDRIGHLPRVLAAATNLAQGKELSPGDLEAAALHGRTRRKQGYTIPLLIREERLLQATIADHIRQNLLSINIDYLMPDFASILWSINALLERSAGSLLQGKDVRSRNVKKLSAKSSERN